MSIISLPLSLVVSVRAFKFSALSATFFVALVAALAIVENACCQGINFDTGNAKPLKLVGSQGTCGSAILINSTVITNYHLFATLCPNDVCTGVTVFSAAATNSEVAFQSLRRLRSAPAYDLASLELQASPEVLHSLPTAKDFAPEVRQGMISFSFPACKEMQVLSAERTVDLGPLYFEAPFPLQHGSSGGAVFAATGNLAGIIAEADTMETGFSSSLSGSGFSSSRIVPRARVDELLGENDERLRELQLEALLDFFNARIGRQKGLLRIEESSRFISRLKAFALDSQFQGKDLRALLIAIDNYPYPLFMRDGWGLESLSSTGVALAFAASLEQYGTRSSMLLELNEGQRKEIAARFQKSFPESRDRLGILFSSDSLALRQGASYELVSVVFPIMAGFIGVCAAWLFGAGLLLGRPASSVLVKLGRLALWSVLLLAGTVFSFYQLRP